MTRGNQRELARARNQKKQLEIQKKKGANDKSSNAGLTLEQRKHRDAELMREKQRRKQEALANGVGTGKIASCETQGPSGSKHGPTKGTPARKRKISEKNKNRKNSTEGSTPSQSTRGGLRVYKIVVLGDGGVGKSALTLQFVSHSFSEYHDPTIEDAYQQQAVIDGEAALLDILDTAGQIEFNAMRDQYMRCGEGFIICYSVTDRHSFQEAVEYKKLINKVRASEDIPLILIGNKCDLQHQRKVTPEEGRSLALQFGCPFFETSAALRHFVDDAFHTLIREIRAKEMGRNSSGRLYHSKWKRLRSILSVIFKKKSRYPF